MERTKELLWDLHDETPQPPMEQPREIEVISPETFGIEPIKAKEMTSGLDTVLAEREVLKSAYLDVIDLPITSENLETFRELRLKIRDNRTKGIEKWHKLNKAFFLNGGRFVDAIKNKEIAINEDWETKLLEAEKFFENQEKARIKALNDARIERLRPYLENVDGQDFSMMDDYDFDDFVEVKKLQFERKKEAERLEAERQEAERLAEIARQKAIEDENKRLKEEAEQAKKEADRLAKIEAEKQAKIQAQLDKERAEAKAKQDVINERNEKLRPYIRFIRDYNKVLNLNDSDFEKELSDLNKVALETIRFESEEADRKQKLIDAENARLAEIEKQRIEAEKLAKAPIQKQLNVWVDGFEIPTAPIDNEVSKDIQAKFNAFKVWAKTQIQK